MRVSVKNSFGIVRTPAEYFQGDSSLVACWNLLPGYGLMDSVGGNHLIAADVLNGHGDFEIVADPFFIISAGMSITGGKGVFNSGSFGSITKLVGIVGKTYEFTFTLDAVTGTGIRVICGATFGITRNSPGTYTERIVSTTNTTLGITGIGGSSGTFDNLTIREVYDGNIGPDGALFNGVSNCLQTTNPINLTGTNKVTLLADVKIHNYNLTATAILFEFSTLFSNAGAFYISTQGTVVNDPLRVLATGNVGGNGSDIWQSGGNELFDKNHHQICALMDFTKAGAGGAEVDFYFDGKKPAKGAIATNNNTGNFGNFQLYIGARAGTSLFSNISLSNVPLLSRILSSEEIADYYAWKNDKRNPHFFSMTLKRSGGLIKKVRENI